MLSKEQIDSSMLGRASDFPMNATRGGQIEQGGSYFSPILGPTDDERAAFAMNPEAFLTYKTLYRCKHCGKEWTQVSVEKMEIPREYVEDEEEEKTDYDAHLEEEEE